MIKTWFTPGLMIINGSTIDALEHSHNAIQLIWPETTCSLNINNALYEQAMIVAPGLSHCLQMESGWILLVEPQSLLGDMIMSALAGAPFKALPDIGYAASIEKSSRFSFEQVIEILAPVWQYLNIPSSQLSKPDINHQLDDRIQRLQSKLNRCFDDECLKPEAWKAASIAQDLALSESRFLHLFKQEMNIAWRPYLLWRRLLCAANAMVKGRNATEAAHIAGFSDSAHLSRTFKKMFGLSIRQAQQSLPSR